MSNYAQNTADAPAYRRSPTERAGDFQRYRVQRGLPAAGTPLNKTERDLLDLLAADVPRSAMAAALGVREISISNRLRKIAAKLGARGKFALYAYARTGEARLPHEQEADRRAAMADRTLSDPAYLANLRTCQDCGVYLSSLAHWRGSVRCRKCAAAARPTTIRSSEYARELVRLREAKRAAARAAAEPAAPEPEEPTGPDA